MGNISSAVKEQYEENIKYNTNHVTPIIARSEQLNQIPTSRTNSENSESPEWETQYDSDQEIIKEFKEPELPKWYSPENVLVSSNAQFEDDVTLRNRFTNGELQPISKSSGVRKFTDKSIEELYIIDSIVLYQTRYARFRRCTSLETGFEFIVKSINKNNEYFYHQTTIETSIRRFVDHPNIIKLYDIFETNKHLHYVMEYCKGQTLLDIIEEHGRMSEKDACRIMQQILSSVAYLHANQIICRRISPESFRFVKSASHLKLLNLRLSRRATRTTVFRTRAGFPFCLAPEVVTGTYTRQSDDWSCGIILFMLLFGCPPFFGDTDIELLQNIRCGRMVRPKNGWEQISRSCRDLIEGLLDINLSTRQTCSQALSGYWMTQSMIEKIPKDLPQRILTHLQEFSMANRFKQFTLILLVQFLEDSVIEDLQHIFREIDTHYTGTLSVQRLINGLGQLGHHGIRPRLDQSRLSALDINGTSSLTYTVFIAAAIERTILLDDTRLLYHVFKYFDINNNGIITAKDLGQMIHLKYSKIETDGCLWANQMIEEVDIDGDGQIDFSEFCLMLKEFPYYHQKSQRVLGCTNLGDSSLFIEKNTLSMGTLHNRKTLLKRAHLLNHWIHMTSKDTTQSINHHTHSSKIKCLLNKKKPVQSENNCIPSSLQKIEAIMNIEKQFLKWRRDHQFKKQLEYPMCVSHPYTQHYEKQVQWNVTTDDDIADAHHEYD